MLLATTRKRYLPGPKVGVERLSPLADVLPLAVAAFELDPEPVLLRRDEAQRGVVDLQIANERRQPQTGRRVVRFPIRDHLLDVHRRRKRVDADVPRIDDGDPVECREPDAAVGRFADLRVVRRTTGEQPDTVGAVEHRALNVLITIAPVRGAGPARHLRHCEADRTA